MTCLQLEIEATDQAIPASSRLSAKRTIIIMITDINDNAPYFVSPSTGVILENSVSGTEVMTVQARDKDKGRNQQVRVLCTVTLTHSVSLTTHSVSLS